MRAADALRRARSLTHTAEQSTAPVQAQTLRATPQAHDGTGHPPNGLNTPKTHQPSMRALLALLAVAAVGVTPLAVATDGDNNGAADYDASLEFALALDKTLGHIRGIETNLGENDAELAAVHAARAIAELHAQAPSHLQDNPEFGAKLQGALAELAESIDSGTARIQVQEAVLAAKAVIHEARGIVIGDHLNSYTRFQIEVMAGLLDAAAQKYGEAVTDGTVVDVAEFQDGSTFVWRASQISQAFRDVIDPVDADRLDQYFDEIDVMLQTRMDPHDLRDMIDVMLYELDQLDAPEMILPTDVPPPLKQIQRGVEPKDVVCNRGLELVFRGNDEPACVSHPAILKLLQLGWHQ